MDAIVERYGTGLVHTVTPLTFPMCELVAHTFTGRYELLW